MPPLTNARVLFNEIPVGLPVPGKTTVYDASRHIDLDVQPLDGGFLLKTLVFSIDHFLRSRMRDSSIKSYSVCPPPLCFFTRTDTPPCATRRNPPSSASRKLPSLPLKPCSLPRLTQLTVAHAPARSLNGFGVVYCSEHPDISPGAHIYGFFPFQEYAVFPPSAAATVRVLVNKERFPWSVYVGVCGMPGQTAHHAWVEFAHPKSA
ncbi:hypothetical protein AcV7_007038 [Taiwanofungus camphoratus]|nr:hypothetical protein AcV7_007038 [Antrodia cinnamomea]